MVRTKRSRLLMSGVSLVLCIAMLIGTTFAWFTDTATSSGNKIQAGNLDVDLIMDKEENGTYTSIAGETAAIFGADSLLAQNKSSDTLWEPGKTQLVYLGVKNNGSLALKYYISMTVSGDLAPALEYALVDGAKAADLAAASNWTEVKTAAGKQTGNVTTGTFTVAKNGVLDEISNGTQFETDYFALAIHMKEDAGNDYSGKNISIDLTVSAAQKEAESDSFDNQYDKSSAFSGFGPQYKYEINQLAEYMNMDGDVLEDMLLVWANDSSNRNKSYAGLLNDIRTKSDALCIAAIYILGTEHFMVSDTDILTKKSTDITKGILNSDVIFKNINKIFEFTADNSISDESYVNLLPLNILKPCNEEVLKVLGLDDSSEIPVTDIYDAFRYSIDHANEESAVINTYTLTANAIYKIMQNTCPDASVSLDDVKASMDRMIAKSEAGTVLDLNLTEFGNASEVEQKQLAYDYATYCYMCMFGLTSGDPAYTALSKHFTEKEFTSAAAIGYVLKSDYIFKKVASVAEALENGNSGEIIYTTYCANLITYNMLSDIYTNYTDDCNDMHKAIGEIFSY